MIGPKWSAITCLSVFHRHLAQGKREKIEDRYRKIIARTKLFFTDSPALYDKTLNQNTFSFQPEDFARWLFSLGAKKVDIIGVTEGRTIYCCQNI